MERRLRQLQAYSGLTIASFASVHVANNLLAIHSQQSYDTVQSVLRSVYQSPRFELVGAVALGTHVLSGILLARRREKLIASHTPHLTLHRATGYVLGGTVLMHIAEMRIGPALRDAFADFATVSYYLHKSPWIHFPLYGLLITSGVYHMSYGSVRVLRSSGWTNFRNSSVLFNGIVGTIAAAGIVALLGFDGHLYDVNRMRFPEISTFADEKWLKWPSWAPRVKLPTISVTY